jgi:hypothetical protein
LHVLRGAQPLRLSLELLRPVAAAVVAAEIADSKV